MLEVLRVGPLATVQDRGRIGYAHLGVPRSGALDLPALARANRLVGNPSGAAGLELSQGRFTALFHTRARVAVTGARAPVGVDGQGFDQTGVVEAGQRLEIGAPTAGMHCYLAVSGGIDVTPVLGSRSTDTLSGLGPPPLQLGDRLRFGTLAEQPKASDDTEAQMGEQIVLRIRFGPREDWFSSPEELTFHTYQVGIASRVGTRLKGPVLNRGIAGELPSEGLMPGAIQVPGNGTPIIFLADHPTTGGYPVIAVVHPADLSSVAQARPGTRVVFRGP